MSLLYLAFFIIITNFSKMKLKYLYYLNRPDLKKLIGKKEVFPGSASPMAILGFLPVNVIYLSLFIIGYSDIVLYLIFNKSNICDNYTILSL